jgi:phosphoribosylformylglycinamidine synthase
VEGNCPQLDLSTEKKLQDTVLELIRNRLINSAHDISEGGLVCTLAECSIINEEKMFGAEVIIPVKSRKDFSYFSESQSRIIVTVPVNKKSAFENILHSIIQSFNLIGTVGGSSLKINDEINVDLETLSDLYFNTISRIMSGEK